MSDYAVTLSRRRPAGVTRRLASLPTSRCSRPSAAATTTRSACCTTGSGGSPFAWPSGSSETALAEDAVQEAFLAVWRSADAYKRERAKPSTWILTVVHRRAVDIVRREQTPARRAARGRARAGLRPGRRGRGAQGPARRGAGGADRAPRRAAAGPRARLLRRPDQSELAERLGVPLGTVKSRMFAGLGRLRELLAADT